MSNFFAARTPPAYLLKRDITGKTPREEKGPGIFYSLFLFLLFKKIKEIKKWGCVFVFL
jgi:hypothetical protein